MDEWLSDRERGGFYSSRMPTTRSTTMVTTSPGHCAEAMAVLPPEEFAVAGPFYDIGEIGDMHHDPAKNVLHVRSTFENIAKANGIGFDVARDLLASAKTKLYAARLKRPTPYVDKTVYVGWNGMCISAYLDAGRVLDLPAVREFALKSLDRVLASAWDAGSGAVPCRQLRRRGCRST